MQRGDNGRRRREWLVPVRRCGKKVSYDKRGAQTARNRRIAEDNLYLRIYPCNKCRGWHLTSQEPRNP